MIHSVKIAVFALMTATPVAVQAQGIPVHDNASLLQHIQTVRNAIQQVQNGKDQILQAKKLYDDLNKLTDVSRIANQLKSDALRQLDTGDLALPGFGNGNLNVVGALRGKADKVYQDLIGRLGQGTSKGIRDAFDLDARNIGIQSALDRSTGASELTSKLTGDNKVTFDDGVRKYFLSNYVRNREGWVPQARKEYFETVLNLSAREEQARWTAFYSKDNPASPQAIFTDLDTIFVEITSVTFLNDKAAQVRFRKIRQRGATKTEQASIANITFALIDTPATEALRLANPLGFQVLTYRADNEVTP